MHRISPLIHRNANLLVRNMENKQFLSLLATKSFVASSQPRMFSTEAPKATEPNSEEVKASKEVMKFDSDDYDDYEPQTKKEKISYYGSVILRLLFLAGGLGLAGFTILELFPGRTSPNSIFSEVFDLLQNNDSVRDITGDGMKAFGRDTGRNTEGRRNHIDSYKYVADDGSKRTRVRFNIKGNKGQVHVWVEVSKDMENNEFVYIICQNARTGRVLTVVDNREMLEAGMIARRSAEEGSLMGTIKGLFSSKNGAPEN